ncbi:MAG TPA: sialate O-acetylesterase [Epulopiscium sp.]|nr:sialate O-acetylesterase [Candidatus Epulonipiscium sp.]
MGKMKVAPIFSDDMVLQRHKKINIWGTGVEGSKVEVTIGDICVKEVVANKQWMVQLPSMMAGGPYTLKVTDGANQVSFKNVMIGEVWFAGGQSNMELELKDSANGKEVVAMANHDNIRFYKTLKTAFMDEASLKEELNTRWKICKSDTAGSMSAVAYYYARELAEELDVTIGIIDCYWGGTSVTCWMSKEYLEKDQDGYGYMKAYEKLVGDKTDEQYDQEMALYHQSYLDWCDRVDCLRDQDPNVSWEIINEKAGSCPWPQPAGNKSPYKPVNLYETMILRVNPYTIRGFIYYQGEEDTYKASLYSNLLIKLIDQWRSDWKDDTLPFLFVQLPMYMAKGEIDNKMWAVLRDQQMKVFKTVKNTGLAVMIDGGEFDNVHPLDKQTVGYRLALQGMKVAYGAFNNADAPTLKDYAFEKDKIRLSFNDMGEKVVVKSDLNRESLIEGFEIAGDDLIFIPATATIDGGEILVWGDNLNRPRHVRYAWTNYGLAPIYNGHGLPLAPFTTSNDLYINEEK